MRHRTGDKRGYRVSDTGIYSDKVVSDQGTDRRMPWCLPDDNGTEDDR